MQVGIVYYAFLADDKWKIIVSQQLGELNDTGLLEISDLHLVLCGDPGKLASAKQIVAEALPGKRYDLQYTVVNRFEYPGIKCLYELACQHPERKYLYFHSKGMVHHSQKGRLPEEVVLFDTVIKPWKKVLQIFEESPHVNKIGFGASYAGFLWSTFMWARGAYLAACQPPVVTSDRYYYESWVGHCGPCMSFIDCYSLHSDNAKQWYSPGEVTEAWANTSRTSLSEAGLHKNGA